MTFINRERIALLESKFHFQFEYCNVPTIVSKSTHESLRVTTNDHEWPRVTTSWPRVTTSDHGWLRVTTSQNASKYFADVIMTSSFLSINHYLTANWPFLEALTPGFDISAISEWGGARGRTGRREGVQTFHLPHALISVTATFLTISLAFHSRFPRFFYLPYTSCPFLPGVANSVHLPPHPHLPRLSVTKGEKKKGNMIIYNIRVNMPVQNLKYQAFAWLPCNQPEKKTCSFGRIWIRIYDRRSLGSQCTKGTRF